MSEPMRAMSSRRQFLQRTSLLSAGAWLAGAPALSAAGNANARLNVGFIGVANRGGANLEETARETSLVNVAALCDVDDNYLLEAQKKHPGAKVHNDFRALIDQKDLDAIVVSTPDHTHAVAAMAALKSGRHVYCEKPLARTVSEARIVTETALKRQRVTQLGTQIHAGANYRRVVELIQARVIGAVKEVHVWVGAVYGGMDRPKDTPPVPPNLHWDLWLGPVEPVPYHPEYAPFKWRNWWAFGGGALADFGCHFMDLPFWALDLKYPESVEVVDGPPVHPHSTPPWLIVRYRFPERRQPVSALPLPPVTLTWYHGGRQPALLSEEHKTYYKSGVLLVGEKGQLLADYTRRVLLPEAEWADFAPPAPSIPASKGHHKEWLEACRSGGQTTCHFGYSGPLTETALLGNAAYRAGAKIQWDGAGLKAAGAPAVAGYVQHRYRKGWKL